MKRRPSFRSPFKLSLYTAFFNVILHDAIAFPISQYVETYHFSLTEHHLFDTSCLSIKNISVLSIVDGRETFFADFNFQST